MCAIPVAQWIARWTSNSKAVGSSPTGDEMLIFVYLFFLLRVGEERRYDPASVYGVQQRRQSEDK